MNPLFQMKEIKDKMYRSKNFRKIIDFRRMPGFLNEKEGNEEEEKENGGMIIEEEATGDEIDEGQLLLCMNL